MSTRRRTTLIGVTVITIILFSIYNLNIRSSGTAIHITQHGTFLQEEEPSITSVESPFCAERFGLSYLDNLRDSATEYCTPESPSSLTCFHTDIAGHYSIDTFCIGRNTIFQSPTGKFHMDCEQRKELDTPETWNAVPQYGHFLRYAYKTGPQVVLDGWVELGNETIDAPEPPEPTSYTILVKREGSGNPWHSLMEVFSMAMTVDVLRIGHRPDDPPSSVLLAEADVKSTQVVLLDDYEDGPYIDLWSMMADKPTIRLADMDKAATTNFIVPLAGGSNPFWRSEWETHPCQDSSLLRNFVSRAFETYHLEPTKSRRSEIVITFIQRMDSRRLVNEDLYLDRIRSLFPQVTVQAIDFAALPFRKQLEAVQSTDILLGVHGAGLAHTMFLPPQSAMIEILPPKLDQKGYGNVASILGHSYFSTHGVIWMEKPEHSDWHGEDIFLDEEDFIDLVSGAVEDLENRRKADSVHSSTDCAPHPVEVPLGDVKIGNTTARGVSLSVGEPEQPFAFLPQWPLNNTFVYGTQRYCDEKFSITACRTFRGGAYDEDSSKTYEAASSRSYQADTSPYPSLFWMTESLKLNSNTTLSHFPMGIPSEDWGAEGYHPQATFGLGRNSSILNALYTAGHIASHSWSMFWGRTGEDEHAEGSFIFGGFDRARTSEKKHTDELNYSNDACPSGMLVTISDMVLNHVNGTDASLFNGLRSAAISACIVPDYPILMTIPRDPYFDRFEKWNNVYLPKRSFGVYYYGMIYMGSSPAYAGDLTITLNSGFSVRIPNKELIVPELTIDEVTGEIHSNSSERELLLNSMQRDNTNDLPFLGRQFLSIVYLMLNQDDNSFTLWEAAKSRGPANVVAVDPKNQLIDSFCAASFTSSSSSPDDEGSSSEKSTDEDSPVLSTGAIAGVVIGAVTAAGMIAAIVLFLVARKRKMQNGLRHSDPVYMYPPDFQPPKELDADPKTWHPNGIQNGFVDIGHIEDSHSSALQAACYHGQESVAQFLLANGVDVNESGGTYGSPLQAACIQGYGKIVQLLLQAGAEVDTVGGPYGTSLTAACAKGHEGIARALLHAGADVNRVELNSHETDRAFALSVACMSDRTEIVQMLLQAGAVIQPGTSQAYCALTVACANGNLEIVKLLLERAVRARKKEGDTDEGQITCSNMPFGAGAGLNQAAFYGHADIVQLLLENGADILIKAGAEFHPESGQSRRSFTRACRTGQEQAVCMMLELGADVKSTQGLVEACTFGHETIVEILLARGAEVNPPGGYDGEGIPLSVACANGHEGIVKRLIFYGADINRVDSPSAPALYEACRQGNETIVRSLLQGGALINEQASEWNPLSVACQHSHQMIAKLLLEAGANPNLPLDSSYDNPLSIVCRDGSVELAELLLAHGARIDNGSSDRESHLYTACEAGSISIAKLLLRNGADANGAGGLFGSPLAAAGTLPDDEIAQLLVDAGGDLGEKKSDLRLELAVLGKSSTLYI
ncbi:hypothetical protein FE257_009303 [Aspergillus nanangensis]|uniref:Glycosyltransferase 61 catalytic domain-containing protein n=1 Tax=Aspergillus nanangensis TaxID=2582783 RepID=A0AAD4CK53_ASPNN|nr:hypothetical protein FE257_009303 [Aspergillus nanangensis]